MSFLMTHTAFSEESKKESVPKPNIYDLIVSGNLKEAQKICPDGELKKALESLLSLNTKVAETYESDIGKKITLTVRGLPLTGTLTKIKGNSLYMKLNRGKGSVVMPINMNTLPVNERLNKVKLPELARNICLGVKFSRQKNYKVAEIFFKKTGSQSEGLQDSLQRKSNYFLSMLAACHNENIEEIDKLIKKGGNVNGVCSAMVMNPRTKKHSLQYSTLLIETIKHKTLKSTEHLVKSGANVNAQNSKGVTPLMFAIICFPDNTDMLEFLIKNRAKIYHQDMEGNTPLSGAIALRRKEAVKILLQNKANPNDATSKGYTPLMIAIQANNPEIFKMLLDAGADINKRFPKTRRVPKGWTVFQLDRSQMHKEIREILQRLQPARKKPKKQQYSGHGVKVIP